MPLLKVAYCTLTALDLSRAQEVFNKMKHPISLNALLTYKLPSHAVSTVIPVTVIDDLTGLIDMSDDDTHILNVTAILGNHNVAHIASGPAIFRQRHCRADPAPPPVTAVFDATSDEYDSDNRSIKDYSSMTPATIANMPAALVSGADTSPLHAASPLRVHHLWWKACLPILHTNDTIPLDLLLDDGSHLVLIRSDIVDTLGLCHIKLQHPEPFSSAFDSTCNSITHFVKLTLHDPSNVWSSRPVHALIVHSLCAPMILGLHFLIHNNLVVDYAARSMIHKPSGFDLLHPCETLPVPPPIKVSPYEQYCQNKSETQQNYELKKTIIKELHKHFSKFPRPIDSEFVKPFDVVAAVHQHIESLEHSLHLSQ
ncbi:hypothetical protein GYMLUDRAFT_63242 [Collybiopsis luxurians FD-317 M1]|uniref:Uncharacterized protein n=1 Tax=Collybiopsis luxurians FD-317 M1 TaxID=944289 RepID=A0A0D0CH59_9AGAR|nr:hypothetical protein GYMLUDRAFT_63242 [Collybiopsis luxurians FD-317 M1]